MSSNVGMKKVISVGGLTLIAGGIALLATDQLAFGPEIAGTFISSRTFLFPIGVGAVLVGGIAVLAGTVVEVVITQGR